MSEHVCRGIVDCESHPKVTVSKFRSCYPPFPWEVWEPHIAGVEFFPTHAEAIDFATRQAQKEATK